VPPAEPTEEYEQEVARLRAAAEDRKKEPFMQQFQINKWIRVALSSVVTLTGFLLLLADNINWNGLLGAKTGATIVMVIGLIKVAYAALAPSANQATKPTGGTVVTQVAVGPNPAGPSNPHI
jgi:hypothetical protein